MTTKGSHYFPPTIPADRSELETAIGSEPNSAICRVTQAKSHLFPQSVLSPVKMGFITSFTCLHEVLLQVRLLNFPVWLAGISATRVLPFVVCNPSPHIYFSHLKMCPLPCPHEPKLNLRSGCRSILPESISIKIYKIIRWI